MTERAVVFRCHDDELIGILHTGDSEQRIGVLVIVGGPQYRVGSHRQFTLLSRALAAEGTPSFRFDYRGMGDSTGNIRSFEHVRADIRAAIDVFCAETPGLQAVVLWGLCDAASAALDYAWRDSRVQGLVLLNPWIRTEQGLAKAYLKHYYWQRLSSPDFWSEMYKGRVNPLSSIRSLLSMFKTALRPQDSKRRKQVLVYEAEDGRFHDEPIAPQLPLPERMAEAWRRFNGHTLLILSGKDLTAAEFVDCVSKSPEWINLLSNERVLRLSVSDANHTFSSAVWRKSIEEKTIDWLKTLS